jgi:hypothetical protein
MGVDIMLNITLVNAVKDFPFLKAVMERNVEKDMVFGMECYVYEDHNGESLYDWNYDVGISDEDIMKEIERQKPQMEREHCWDDDDLDELKREYVDFMNSHECYGYHHCIEL